MTNGSQLLVSEYQYVCFIWIKFPCARLTTTCRAKRFFIFLHTNRVQGHFPFPITTNDYIMIITRMGDNCFQCLLLVYCCNLKLWRCLFYLYENSLRSTAEWISITVKFFQELDIIAYLFNDPTSDGCINPKNLQLKYWTGVLKVVYPQKSHHHLHVLCPSLKIQIREDAIILLKWLSIFMFLSTYKTLIFIRKHNLSSLWYLWL